RQRHPVVHAQRPGLGRPQLSRHASFTLQRPRASARPAGRVIRLRYANELVGLLVILALVLFLGVAFQAGVLSRWFQPTHILRIILPEKGSAGLSSGGDVEMLGTKAGEVRRVVITPNQQMYAEADIEDQAQPFVAATALPSFASALAWPGQPMSTSRAAKARRSTGALP